MLSEEIYYFKLKFTDIYQHTVLPALRLVENDRKKWAASSLLFKQRIVVFFTALFTFLSLFLSTQVKVKDVAAPTIFDEIYAIWTTPEVLLFLVFASLIGACLCYILSVLCRKKFEEKLKENVMPIAVKAYNSLKWSISSIIPSGEIVASKLFNSEKLKSVRVATGDSFMGSFKEHSFKMSEITLTTNSKASENIFDGVLISVEIPRRILGNTVVKSVNGTCSVDYEEISIFDEYSKYFKVVSTDKLEGRYLASDSFLECLLELKKLFNAKDVECSFFEHRLLIALTGAKSLFFIGDFDHSLLDTTQYTLFLDKLVAVFEIIEALRIY